jgi:hypothetical protein
MVARKAQRMPRPVHSQEHEAISAASSYRWRGLLGEGCLGGEVVHHRPTPAFVDLGALNCTSLPSPRLDLKLDLGDGLILHLVRS